MNINNIVVYSAPVRFIGVQGIKVKKVLFLYKIITDIFAYMPKKSYLCISKGGKID